MAINYKKMDKNNFADVDKSLKHNIAMEEYFQELCTLSDKFQAEDALKVKSSKIVWRE